MEGGRGLGEGCKREGGKTSGEGEGESEQRHLVVSEDWWGEGATRRGRKSGRERQNL